MRLGALAAALACAAVARGGVAQRPRPVFSYPLDWHPGRAMDLHPLYWQIFRKDNRNAASHLWATFILERSRALSWAGRTGDLQQGRNRHCMRSLQLCSNYLILNPRGRRLHAYIILCVSLTCTHA